MPPLNRLFENQENTAWSRQLPSQDGSRLNSFASTNSANKESSSKVQSARRPHFNDCHKIHHMPGRGEFSKQEIQDCWYTANELASFRLNICTTLYLFKVDPTRVDCGEYTMRGLERKLEEASCRKNCLRARARSAVLDEQDFQVGIGEVSPERLAAVYSIAAREAVLDAINLAALDQMDAFCYQNQSPIDELFPDEWISSISSNEWNKRQINHSPNKPPTDQGSPEDLSGFDDSWLRDIAVNS